MPTSLGRLEEEGRIKKKDKDKRRKREDGRKRADKNEKKKMLELGLGEWVVVQWALCG